MESRPYFASHQLGGGGIHHEREHGASYAICDANVQMTIALTTITSTRSAHSATVVLRRSRARGTGRAVSNTS